MRLDSIVSTRHLDWMETTEMLGGELYYVESRDCCLSGDEGHSWSEALWKAHRVTDDRISAVDDGDLISSLHQPPHWFDFRHTSGFTHLLNPPVPPSSICDRANLDEQNGGGARCFACQIIDAGSKGPENIRLYHILHYIRVMLIRILIVWACNSGTSETTEMDTRQT